MGGLLLIAPIVAFDVWLGCTTGKRQCSIWLARKEWRRLAGAAGAGLLLAVWLAFFLQYHVGPDLLKGFPIPWGHTTLPRAVACLGAGADFLTGLAAPFIPFKIAQFLKEVKAELGTK
jgi:hypothetical protein